MYNIFDIANWFLSKSSMTHKKLQKLCYYTQAWSYVLVESGKLNEEYFEAWVHGPVNRKLWNELKEYGYNNIEQNHFENKSHPIIDDEIISLLEEIYSVYGKFSGYQLETLTHSEEPWKKARIGYESLSPSNVIISPKDIIDYYGKQISQEGIGE